LDTSPKQIRITNIGSSSFVVSWITEEKTTGTVLVGETKEPDEIRRDVRDKEKGSDQIYINHYVLVDNLKPQTKYFFKIISNGKSYDNFGKLFEVTTPSLKVPKDNDIAQGKILTPSQSPASGAIVYLSLANTIVQSAITDEGGHWMIPLSTARTVDLSDFSNYDRSAQVEEIFVVGEKETASATLSTNMDNPTPDIILGQNFNFLNQLSLASPTPTFIQNSTSKFETSGSQISGDSPELKIIFPSENEKVNSSLPEFLGTAPKNQKIEIIVESNEKIKDQAIADSDGNWQWTTKIPLSPGEHQITVSYADKDGFIKKTTRKFIVLAAGESDLPSFTATPSGKKATSTPTLIPTATPTRISTPTIKITPTEKPSEVTPTPEKETPATGNLLPIKAFFAAGIITIFIGIAIVFF